MVNEAQLIELSRTIIDLNHAMRVGDEDGEPIEQIQEYARQQEDAERELYHLLRDEDIRFFVTVDGVRYLGVHDSDPQAVYFWEFDDIPCYGEPIPGRS